VRALRHPAASAAILLLCAAWLCAPGLARAAPVGVTCKSYLVYDLTADQLVAVSNAENRQPVASLTKLMTAILCCEKLRFDGRYILTPEERKTFGVDTMRADKLLEMMLVASNNAACKVVARIAAGDEQSFAALMNQRARELGLAETRFANASGLPGGEQYSSMRDVLSLLRSALRYPPIEQAMHEGCVECGSGRYEATLEALYKRHPGLWGGKTGYTKAAGRCLALLYRSGGRDYALVSFGSKGVKDSFRDTELILADAGLYSGDVGEWK
jgi:serine-type D-Ala-D-Ala carboxypeptidase (penicillin-binding protein 5/6)